MALTPEYVKQVEEWLQWYNYQAANKPLQGVEQRLAFLEKGLRGAFIILAGLTYEVERVDLRGAAPPERRLVIPTTFRAPTT